MNKNIIYILVALVVGVLVGWFIFDNSNTSTASQNASDQHDHAGESGAQMWTCSMHPQIMQPEPGDCPLCGMDLIPAESGAEGLAMNEIKMTANAMALANIQTTVVGNAMSSDNDEEGMLSLSGKIAVNEENMSVQSSYFDGRIERLNVTYDGQQVTRGQMLATIYAPTLVAAQQELITTASLKSAQPALYNAVRNKLKNWKLSEKQIDAIESSGKVVENFPIYATVSGTVSEVMAREGDYVKQGQPILKLSNLNSVWAQFDAYENQISNVKEGQKIQIVANAYPNKVFDATVSFIDPMLNNATRTVTVRATLKNTDDVFKPGMFVTGKVKSNAKKDTGEVLTIPASAIMWTGERSLVYIKTNPSEPVFEMREVTIGNRNGDQYTILKGLNNGDEIVTNGTFTVDAAAQLQGKKSMMNNAKKAGDPIAMSDMEIELSPPFQKEFIKIFKPYLQMKDAFVASNAAQVSIHAKATLKVMKSLELGDLGTLEKAHITKGLEMLDVISKNDALDNQRAHFVIFNENIIPLAMNVSIPEAKIFVQKCPMANNDKGAVWLSSEEGIKNPYYGEQMMTCGSVIETIQ